MSRKYKLFSELTEEDKAQLLKAYVSARDELITNIYNTVQRCKESGKTDEMIVGGLVNHALGVYDDREQLALIGMTAVVEAYNHTKSNNAEVPPEEWAGYVLRYEVMRESALKAIDSIIAVTNYDNQGLNAILIAKRSLCDANQTAVALANGIASVELARERERANAMAEALRDMAPTTASTAALTAHDLSRQKSGE